MSDDHNRRPQDKVCAYEYTVRRGDSFYLIAHRLGVPLRDLLDANSSINPARLMVGDVLCIPMEEDDRPPATTPEPAPAEPEPEPEPEITDELDDLDSPAQTGQVPEACPESSRYTVQEGQSLTDIQLAEDVTLHTLESANPGVDLEQLMPGQTLCVPAEGIPCGTPTVMTLANGDTLERVALRLNTSMGALLRANPCMAPSDFMEGAIIHIPR
ncbi:MAG: LysM peptidoglycan-binding domain-containing protein [Aristaeellaceae bacterium]